MKTILVTGAAGFIGHFVSERLLSQGYRVIGVDNFNAYYDPHLKEARINRLKSMNHSSSFELIRADLQDRHSVESVFGAQTLHGVIHLAAQAGVRYSLTNPQAYIDSNITGFLNVLECLRTNPVHLVYASSSSVYGGNRQLPFSENQSVDRPVSLYAATKKANELMAHTYSHLFDIPATGLRFFTVFGPWGRPDMAAFKFVRAILMDKPIDIYNHGEMQRDFTYVDDIVEGVIQAFLHPPVREPSRGEFAFETFPAHRVLNIGNHHPEPLTVFIEAIENALGMKARKNFLPMQPGDVPATYADTQALRNLTGFAPYTPLEEGVGRFVSWYKEYYGV